MREKLGTVWPYCVTKDDLEITHYKGSGAGGQKKNKTSSGTRIKHIPTGITTKSDEHRSQTQNKICAFRKLADQLIPLMKSETQKQRYAAGTERIRTYHEPRNEVIDQRSSEIFNYSDVLDGSMLDRLIESILVSKD